MNGTRCFICIDFPDVVIKEVARLQRILKKKGFQGKLIELENLHLTLKFIGEIDQDKLKRIKEKLNNIEFDEIDSNLGNLGLFIYRHKPKIVWIKVQGKMIWELQKKIDYLLNEEGLEKENKFMSHLTLARINFVEDVDSFKYYIENMGVKDISFKINKFKLKKSILKNLGPIYEDLAEYPSNDLKNINIK